MLNKPYMPLDWEHELTTMQTKILRDAQGRMDEFRAVIGN